MKTSLAKKTQLAIKSQKSVAKSIKGEYKKMAKAVNKYIKG